MATHDRRAPVLLVEDNENVRQIIIHSLERDGCRVVTAADGEEALATLRRGLMPRLILLDLMMPRKDGFQFREEQLQDPKLAAIPVVAYSGHYDAKGNAERLHADAYFQTPLDIRRLRELVGTYT